MCGCKENWYDLKNKQLVPLCDNCVPKLIRILTSVRYILCSSKRPKPLHLSPPTPPNILTKIPIHLAPPISVEESLNWADRYRLLSEISFTNDNLQPPPFLHHCLCGRPSHTKYIHLLTPPPPLNCPPQLFYQHSPPIISPLPSYCHTWYSFSLVISTPPPFRTDVNSHPISLTASSYKPPWLNFLWNK